MPAITLPPDLAAKLEAVRAQIGRHRIEAFVDRPLRLCGLDLEPLSLRTYARLVAFDSPFVHSGPVDFEAIAVFVWVHHPRFSADAAERARVLRQVWRALHPRFPNLNSFFRLAAEVFRSPLLRRLSVKTAAQRYAEAAARIRYEIDTALADLPRAAGAGEDEDGNPKVDTVGSPVGLPAQLINQLARSIGIDALRIEALPLVRVVQLYRESVFAAGGADGIASMHPAEAAVWRAYLDNASN